MVIVAHFLDLLIIVFLKLSLFLFPFLPLLQLYHHIILFFSFNALVLLTPVTLSSGMNKQKQFLTEKDT
jgi:hypothetical protein